MGNITFLGVEGSGKTVLTMALVNLFKAHAQEGWFLRPETRSAFRFVEQVPTVLEPGSLPHQTTELRHLAMSVVKDGEVQRVFDILDYPGEIYRLAFLDAKDDPDPATFQARVEANQEEIRALLGHLQGSDRVYVLFNLADAQDLAHNAQNLDAVWLTNACLDYLHRLPSHPEIALLLTQIDLYGNPDDPNLNPRRIAQQALPLIAYNFPNLTIQAVSALGPASGPFGVDNILANCLKDTPAVEAYLALDLNAALDNLLSHIRDFTNDLGSYYFSSAQKAANLLSQKLIESRESVIWFVKEERSKVEKCVEAVLQDWDSLKAQYQIYGQSFCTSEATLPVFLPKTEAGTKWLQVCREKCDAYIREMQCQAEERARVEAYRKQKQACLQRMGEWLLLLALVWFVIRPVMKGLYRWLTALETPEEYRKIADALGVLDGAPTILCAYVCVMVACLLLLCGVIGLKRSESFLRQVEKRRGLVVILGGVVTVWLVLLTLSLA